MSGITDRIRRTVTVVAAVGQVALPTLLAPRFRRELAPPDVLQPAPATFAVWLPIFGTSLLHAASQVSARHRDDPVIRAVGWPAAGAYAATAAWAPLVASGRFWPAQSMLAGIATCAEVARRRVAAAESSGTIDPAVRAIVAPAAGLLAGWGAAACAVNLGSMVVATDRVRSGRPAELFGAVLTLGTAAAATVAATSAPGRGATLAARTHLATAAWALAGRR